MNNSLKIVFICFLTLCVTPSFALKMKPVSIQQLSEQSDVVALVEINDSHQIKSSTISCGIEHKAFAYNILKGNIKGTLNFGYMKGLKTGNKYLVFLNKNTPDNKAIIFTSDNFQKQFSDKVTLAECKKIQLAKHTLSQAGMAFFEIKTPALLDFKLGLLIPGKYFEIPKDVKSTVDKPTSNSFWVELDEITSTIKAVIKH